MIFQKVHLTTRNDHMHACTVHLLILTSTNSGDSDADTDKATVASYYVVNLVVFICCYYDSMMYDK